MASTQRTSRVTGFRDSDELLIMHANRHGQGHHESVWRTWGELVELAWKAGQHDCGGRWDQSALRKGLEAALTYSDDELAGFRAR